MYMVLGTCKVCMNQPEFWKKCYNPKKLFLGGRAAAYLCVIPLCVCVYANICEQFQLISIAE